jgi:hypothetical protein
LLVAGRWFFSKLGPQPGVPEDCCSLTPKTMAAIRQFGQFFVASVIATR